MNELAPTLTDLKGKIEKLVGLHQQLKQENDRLNTENKKLLQEIDNQKIVVDKLEKTNQELLKNKNEEHNTLTDTKQTINGLVQEIDNCIALLK